MWQGDALAHEAGLSCLFGWGSSDSHGASMFGYILALLVVASYARKRFTCSKRSVAWAEQLVVITGTTSGLGFELNKEIVSRGGHVISLDINRPEIEIPQTTYIHCDISKPREVISTSQLIRKAYGHPTILINNAGTMIPHKLEHSKHQDVEKTFAVNTLAHFGLIKEFLPEMINKDSGHIISICSTLSYLGVAYLSDYCASKAASLSLHESLCAELKMRNSRVNCLALTLGQLDSPMFSKMQSPSRFLAPVLHTKDTARRIVQAIERSETGVLGVPFYARFMPLLRSLPGPLQTIARSLSSVDHAALQFYSQRNGTGNMQT